MTTKLLNNNQNVELELLSLLYTQARPAILGSLLVSSCLVFILWGIVTNLLLLAWFGLMLVVTLLRAIIIKIYLKKKPSEIHFWRNLFILMTGMTGLIWSLVGTFLLPSSEVYQTVTAFALAGVSSGAIPYFSGSRIAAAVFVVPILFSFAICLFLQSTAAHQILGILTLLYLVLLIISSFRTHHAIVSAIKLKFENDELLSNLSAEITERKLAEKLLRDSEEQYRLVTDALPALISYIDNDFYFRYINKAYEDWFGKPLHTMIDKPIQQILGKTAYTIFLENIETIKNKTTIHYETIMHFRENEERYVSVTIIPHMKDNTLSGFFSLISDMTPRINYLATHDVLTDLPNRSLFNERFSQSLKRATTKNYPVGLLFLDIDHFKNINDTMGHDVGDSLLIKVAKRIKQVLRKEDTLARLGGDEFTIVLENIHKNEILSIATQICQAFLIPFSLEGKDIFVTASIGISIFPVDGHDMQILMKNADMAIYLAKEKGRNRFEFFTTELNNRILKKLAIESHLRLALEKNQLFVEYQPVHDIKQSKITSLEALLRWNIPELGPIPPAEFIPIAEELGIIVPIGEWLIRTVCQHQVQLQHEGIFTSVSINISARQFREKNLAVIITSILKETGLEGNCLTLELTESLIMQDIEYSIRVIKALKELGIKISIDDFGTGYSSLSYLQKFPIDILKIDRSFVNHIASNQDDESIVSAIIAMAHSLRLIVIAEGVETSEQLAILQKNHCDQIQGYLISKPIPFDKAKTFMGAILVG